MIEWYWAVFALIGGAIFGFVVCGLLSTDDRATHIKWWEE